MEEMIIEKVRSRVFLYDLKSPDYRDHEITTNAWEEIGKELKIKRKFLHLLLYLFIYELSMLSFALL